LWAQKVSLFSSSFSDYRVAGGLICSFPDRPAGRNLLLFFYAGWRGPSASADRAGQHRLSVLETRPQTSTTSQNLRLASFCAKATLEKRGLGHGASGEEARRGMETRQRVAQERAVEIAQKLVDDAPSRVFIV
jgi:hypothetical protein